MKDTVTCPNPECASENAYFDGAVYICPDCGFEWDSKGLVKKAISIGNSEDYERLIRLNKPFFKLKHGKLYECKVEHSEGIEDTTIIPLAFQKNKNKQFVMTDARRLFKESPKSVYEIIKMDFDYISNDGIRSDYPFDYEAMTIVCSTANNKTLLDFNGMTYFDFEETDEV